MPENWKLANAAITDMQMRQRDVAALDAKYTKELADAKLKMMLCVMMLLLVVVGCTSKQSACQCVKPPPASGADNAASPRLADTAERDYFTLRERLITMQKQLEGTQKYTSSADRVAHRWATHAIIVSNTHALPAEYKCLKVIKPSNPFTNVAGFCFNNIFCAATNLAASGCLSAQFQKRRNDG